LIERVERLRELRLDGLAGLEPLDQNAEVVSFLLEGMNELAILLETSPPLQDFLRFGLVFPEIGGGGFRFELGQFLFGTSGLKDSSADLKRAC